MAGMGGYPRPTRADVPEVYIDPSGQVYDYVRTQDNVRDNAGNPIGYGPGYRGYIPGQWVQRKGADGGGFGALDALWKKLQGMMPKMPRITPPSMEDFTAAQTAEYGRAKDQVGKQGAASMRALRNAMQSRGISGSGIEAEGMGQVYGQQTGQLGEVSRNQAEGRLRRQIDIANMGYQGDINQRGQDLSVYQGFAGMVPSLMALYRNSNLWGPPTTGVPGSHTGGMNIGNLY